MPQIINQHSTRSRAHFVSNKITNPPYIYGIISMPAASDDLPRGPSPFTSPFLATELQSPPLPRSQRALRRLHSAHTLGAKPLGAKSSFPSLPRSRAGQLRQSPSQLSPLYQLFQQPPPQQQQQIRDPFLQPRLSQQFRTTLRPQNPLPPQQLPKGPKQKENRDGVAQQEEEKGAEDEDEEDDQSTFLGPRTTTEQQFLQPPPHQLDPHQLLSKSSESHLDRPRQKSPERVLLPPMQDRRLLRQAPILSGQLPERQQQQQLSCSQIGPLQDQSTGHPHNPSVNRSSSVRHGAGNSNFATRAAAATRYRANSEAPLPNSVKVASAASAAAATTANPPTAAPVPRRTLAPKPVFSHGRLTLSQIIRDGPSDRDFVGALETARWKIADEGIKSELDGMSTTRIYIWLILLDGPIMKTDEYLDLIHRGPSPAYSKIRNDTFRTLTTDPLFRRRVSEASLIRLLNAVAWKLHDSREVVLRQARAPDPSAASSGDSAVSQDVTPGPFSTVSAGASSASSVSSVSSSGGTGAGVSTRADGKRDRGFTVATDVSESSVSSESGTYVQGMNVLAAPFLYAARSEAEAFVAFYSLLTKECPGYIRGAMDGVHRGLKLVDKVLDIVDPKLSKYLRGKGMTAEIYAFPSVLTLSACTPPLPEVLRLWDFLFAYGPHLNIICIVAQLSRIRDEILQAPRCV